MLDQRRLYRDLLAILLAAVVVFLALALVSYDPADPVAALTPPLNLVYQADPLIHPPHVQAGNYCGYWGALAADLLLNLLGVGAYYLVLSLAVLDVQLLRRREIDLPALRMTGW